MALAAVSGNAKADDPAGGTVVLNTYNSVLPMLVGDDLGPKNSDGTPKVGKDTGDGYWDSQLKIDDSPSAVANYANEVDLLITSSRTDNTAVNNGGTPSYMQGEFSIVKLTQQGPQLSTMARIDLPEGDGERNWQKPNIMATDKYYLLVAASEDNGENNNPQVVAFVYDKTTLKPVTVLNSNRSDSTTKPTNLIELSGQNDGQQYGPHSIVRLAENSFVMGVQRNNQAAYVLRVTVDETPATGVNLNVNYLSKVLNDARHCRPDITADGFMTTVEANNQPADIGIRAIQFDVNTGKVLQSKLIAKSNPNNNQYAVQPNIADLGNYIGISYQMSEKTGKNGGNGHTGGSNLSMVQIVEKATLATMGDPVSSIAPNARHAGSIGALWGVDGSETPSFVSLAGSSTGTGKGMAQIVPMDMTTNLLGVKDPGKLYEVSTYSDIAGTVTRGKRNPNDQGRGFIYAYANIPNPGYKGGSMSFMPEVKSFIGSAVSGYTTATTATLAARESIWLSLVPASWETGISTTPGTATPTPGTGAGGLGPLPRTNTQGTNVNPNGTTAANGDENVGAPPMGSSGCACTTAHTSSSESGGAAALAILFGLLIARRRQSKEA
jgi:MYXO-CTERM domain-containing protein